MSTHKGPSYSPGSTRHDHCLSFEKGIAAISVPLPLPFTKYHPPSPTPRQCQSTDSLLGTFFPRFLLPVLARFSKVYQSANLRCFSTLWDHFAFVWNPLFFHLSSARRALLGVVPSSCASAASDLAEGGVSILFWKTNRFLYSSREPSFTTFPRSSGWQLLYRLTCVLLTSSSQVRPARTTILRSWP